MSQGEKANIEGVARPSASRTAIVLIVGITTMLFGLFGVIPAVVLAKRARGDIRASRLPWQVFGIVVGVQVVLGLLVGVFAYRSQTAGTVADQPNDMADVAYVAAHAPSSITFKYAGKTYTATQSRTWQDSPDGVNVGYDLDGQTTLVICVNPKLVVAGNVKCGNTAVGTDTKTWHGKKVALGGTGTSGLPINDSYLSNQVFGTFLTALG